jgi:hypothetical protein
MHPEIIQSFLQDSSGNEGEQHKDDGLKSMSSLSSSPFLCSPSLPSSSSPSQPQSPQANTRPTLQKSASTPPLTEPYSTAATTTKPPVVSMASSDKESDIQSLAPTLLEQQPPVKEQHNSPGVAAVAAAPKQGESTHRDKISPPVNMRLKDHNQNQEQINPTPTWTAAFLGMEVRIPKSILLGLKQSSCTQELLLDTSEETASQSFYERNHKAREERTTHFPNENISALTSAPSEAFGNSVLPAQESSQVVVEEEESIRNQALRSSRFNSDQIETLPVGNITANSSSINNSSDPANLPINVLDGNYDTSWSNKGRGWLSLDLGTIKNIQSMAIAWYRGDSFDYYYSISLSNDGIIFTEVKSGSSGGNSRLSQQYLVGAGYRARYIKITVNGNNMNDMGGITQVDVYGW